MEWKSMADVEKDLLSFAEYSVPTPEEEEETRKMPDCIREYYKQMEQNQRAGNLCGDLDEGATYVISGRGRGTKHRLVRPGQAVEPHPSDDAELRKKIREVAGLGFSNKLIEQSLKNHSLSDEEIYKDHVPTLKWDEPSSSSKTTSSESSPAKPKLQRKISPDSESDTSGSTKFNNDFPSLPRSS